MRDPSPDLIDQTIAVWQPLTREAVHKEDARRLIANVAGLFSVLMEWDSHQAEVVTETAIERQEVVTDVSHCP